MKKAGAHDGVYDLAAMERELARIAYAGTALGIAGLLGNTLALSGLKLALMGNVYALGRLAAGGGTWLTVAVLLVFFLLRRRTALAGRVLAYPHAANYFEMSRSGPARAIAAGTIWAAAFTAAVLEENSFYMSIFGDVSNVAAFFTALWGFERHRMARVTVTRALDETGADVFDRSLEKKKVIIKWALYWAAVLGLYAVSVVVFESFVLYAPVVVLAAVNCLLRVIFIRPMRPYASMKGRRVTVRILNLLTVAITVFIAAFVIFTGFELNNWYIARLDYSVFEHHSEASYDPDTGVYTLRADHEGFKILQLTDTHIGGSITTVGLDKRAFDACYDIIRSTQPDLIVITGDLVYPAPEQSFSTNNMASMNELVFFMNCVGIPWCMEYGNHDTQGSANYDGAAIDSTLRHMSMNNYKYSSLLYADVQPDVYGRYNQYIRIEDTDGSLERVCFLIDSNDYVEGGREINDYDCVHSDQIQWYEDTIDALERQEGRRVPSFVFMHIPFREFADAAEALKAGDPEAEYLFGENGEDVSCPEMDSGFFQAILDKGSTEAVFVGHDHLNNMAVKYMGVDLVYSKSIDFLAYPGIARMTEQRGGTLITLLPGGGYEMEQVDVSG